MSKILQEALWDIFLVNGLKSVFTIQRRVQKDYHQAKKISAKNHQISSNLSDFYKKDQF